MVKGKLIIEQVAMFWNVRTHICLVGKKNHLREFFPKSNIA